MDTPQLLRRPLVKTIVEEVATGFVMGGVLGSAFHFAKDGCFQTACKKMPCMGCSLAAFFGVSVAIDYAMVSARGKEEPALDGAVAMGGAAGITRLHRGFRYAGRYALGGAAFGGVAIGGLGLLVDWLDRDLPPPAKQADDDPGHPAPALRPTLPVDAPWTPSVAEKIGS